MTTSGEQLHRTRRQAQPRRESASGPEAWADLMLPGVIAACFVPVGLLVIAAHGGGLPAVIIAFIALVLITAVLTGLIKRAVDAPATDDP